MIFVVVLYALLAITFPLGQLALQYTNPLFLIATRMLIAGAVLLVYWALVQHKKRRLSLTTILKKHGWLFAQVVIFHIYLGFVPEFWALQYLSSLKVNLLYATTPFIAAFFEYLFYKKKMGGYKISGITIGFIGMMPLLLFTNHTAAQLPEYPYPIMPVLALMLAIISAAYAWFVIKDLMQVGYSMIFINGVGMLAGGILCLLSCPLFHAPLQVSDMRMFLIYTFALIAISNIIVYNLYGALLRTYSMTFVSLAGFLSPIFGAFYAWLFFGESITWHYVIAFILIFLGLHIFYKEEKGSSVILQEKS